MTPLRLTLLEPTRSLRPLWADQPPLKCANLKPAGYVSGVDWIVAGLRDGR